MTEQKESKIPTKKATGFSLFDYGALGRLKENYFSGSYYYPAGLGRTYGTEKESREGAIDNIILDEIKEFRRESKDSFASLDEKSQKIEKLQRELNEKTQAISELLAVRKNTKNVYYIGLLTGIIGIIAGFFSNFVYTLAGLSITITASVGIYEARKNKW